ncbi:MAG TPA: phosphoribosylaminoimidazolesuccinocarboxamide synthase [Acidimicrobiales bacterium]|nr:phosphoribosylaminoimidazolesuccinocarboxamide synthase [Acidimicrobiales bacterium]
MASLSDLGLAHLYSGKVRDLYAVDDDHMLMVASDRMSAYDVIMAEPIPEKGRVLTGLTHFWVREFAGEVPSALVSCDPAVIDERVPGFAAHHEWHGRTMLVRRAEMVPLECIVRGRLAGQAYEEYVASATVHHMPAPAGLELTDPFPEPLFTPSTKAEEGHDLNIDLATAASIVGADVLAGAQALCLNLFARAAEKMARAGLILADTKFELGVVDGRLVVCDEVITPDSSRIWPADEVRRGQTPPSFDKQPFRDWLDEQSWDRTPPPPHVPDEIVAITSARYVAAYERVSGQRLSDWYGA